MMKKMHMHDKNIVENVEMFLLLNAWSMIGMFTHATSNEMRIQVRFFLDMIYLF